MRLIAVSNEPVSTVAVSPDGRFIAVGTTGEVVLVEWSSGAVDRRYPGGAQQLVFSPDSEWLGVGGRVPSLLPLVPGRQPLSAAFSSRVVYSGGVAFSPEGKHFYACGYTLSPRFERLERWAMPEGRPVAGFDFCHPFPRLVCSADGQYIGGVSRDRYELRIAVTGGLNARLWMRGNPETAFTGFSPDGTRAVVGWDNEMHILETQNGKVVHRLLSVDAPFADAAYTGSGRHLVTVDDGGRLKMWNPQSWNVDSTYHWDSGALTCVACTVDELAGVCGTYSGHVLLFDIDE